MNKNQSINILSSTLYVVPTPIGNLKDITHRALLVLQGVDLIAAEDTRHTKILLQHFAIDTSLFIFHAHNENKKVKILLSKLQLGQSIALVSDAGTPLINDPGYFLVKCCRDIGIRVVPLPGACAAITALSASGLPASRFCYEGFLPAKHKYKLKLLRDLSQESRTLIFYDSTRRLVSSLKDMIIVWGPERYVVLARELTKIWESIYGAPLLQLLAWVESDKICCRGEVVLVVEGYHRDDNKLILEVLRTIKLLIPEFSLRKAVTLAADIHGIKKNYLYKYMINQKKNN